MKREHQPYAHLASVACLPCARVRLQLALDNVGEFLRAALETRQLHLGRRCRVGWPVAGVVGPLGWTGLGHRVRRPAGSGALPVSGGCRAAPTRAARYRKGGVSSDCSRGAFSTHNENRLEAGRASCLAVSRIGDRNGEMEIAAPDSRCSGAIESANSMQRASPNGREFCPD